MFPAGMQYAGFGNQYGNPALDLIQEIQRRDRAALYPSLGESLSGRLQATFRYEGANYLANNMPNVLPEFKNLETKIKVPEPVQAAAASVAAQPSLATLWTGVGSKTGYDFLPEVAKKQGVNIFKANADKFATLAGKIDFKQVTPEMRTAAAELARTENFANFMKNPLTLQNFIGNLQKSPKAFVNDNLGGITKYLANAPDKEFGRFFAGMVGLSFMAFKVINEGYKQYRSSSFMNEGAGSKTFKVGKAMVEETGKTGVALATGTIAQGLVTALGFTGVAATIASGGAFVLAAAVAGWAANKVFGPSAEPPEFFV